ncbi:hypothetical protein [Herpetosiphon gulosus]|uniref:hypothetical protein n=1 Tax=Herpetosiphon gulosus TaxID=1973496 RepID=UPI0031E85651
MQEPNYHVPSTVKKPKRGIIILSILDLLNTGIFCIGFFSIIGGVACRIDREGICRVALSLGLLISGIFSLSLLVIGFICLDDTSKLMRWMTLGIPLIPILFVASIYLPTLF